MRRTGYRALGWLFLAVAIAALAVAELDLFPNAPGMLFWAGVCSCLSLCFHELAAAERRREAQRRARARAGYIDRRWRR